MEAKPARKMKSVDAVKACEHDAVVLLAVLGSCFLFSILILVQVLLERQIGNDARTLKVEPDLGDA